MKLHEARNRLSELATELLRVATELDGCDAVTVFADACEDGPYYTVKAYRDEAEVFGFTRMGAAAEQG